MISVTNEPHIKHASLLEIARSLNSRLSPAELVSQFISQLSQLMEVEKIIFILKDSNNQFNQYTFDTYRTGEPLSISTLSPDHPFTELLDNTQEIKDIETFHGDYYLDYLEYFEEVNIVLSLPFIANDELLGILNLGPKFSGADYSPKEIELLELVILQAATAIGNSIAYLRLQKTYEDLKMAQEELVHAEKLSAIGQIASAIVHDYRNPMAAIQGYAELIEDCAEEKDIARYGTKIIENVHRLNAMTKELLDFAREEKKAEYQKELCDISYIVHESLYEVEKLLEKNKVRFVENHELQKELQIDKFRMVRALSNLFRNAAEAMPNGGTLIIETQEKEDHAVIKISDTGTGIPEEIQTSIFEPFVTFGKQDGTGLGMAITKQIIEAHEGGIRFDNTSEKGTTFVIDLPL